MKRVNSAQLFKKDTADGDNDLNHSGRDAKWVEDLFKPCQHTPPGQFGKQDGVEADAHETDSSSKVVKEWQVTWLWR